MNYPCGMLYFPLMEQKNKNKPAVFIVGHGSRDTESNDEFRAFVEYYSNKHPGRTVDYGYVELAEPLMGPALDSLAEKVDEITILPLILFRAGHAKHDLAEMVKRVRAGYPDVRFMTADVLGVQAGLANLLSIRAEESRLYQESSPEEISLIIIGRGSSDADANGDLCKIARLVQEKHNWKWVSPCFVGITRPRLEETLELIIKTGPSKVLIVPYFLFTGILIRRIENIINRFAENHRQIEFDLAPYLNIHEKLAEALDLRLSEAEAGKSLLDDPEFLATLPEHAHHHGHHHHHGH